MIRDPECPYCYGSLEAVWDGIAQVLRCPMCEYVEPVCDSEIRRAATAVRRLRDVTDLDDRARVLADLRLVEGKRRRTR